MGSLSKIIDRELKLVVLEHIILVLEAYAIDSDTTKEIANSFQEDEGRIEDLIKHEIQLIKKRIYRLSKKKS